MTGVTEQVSIVDILASIAGYSCTEEQMVEINAHVDAEKLRDILMQLAAWASGGMDITKDHIDCILMQKNLPCFEMNLESLTVFSEEINPKNQQPFLPKKDWALCLEVILAPHADDNTMAVIRCLYDDTERNEPLPFDVPEYLRTLEKRVATLQDADYKNILTALKEGKEPQHTEEVNHSLNRLTLNRPASPSSSILLASHHASLSSLGPEIYHGASQPSNLSDWEVVGDDSRQSKLQPSKSRQRRRSFAVNPEMPVTPNPSTVSAKQDPQAGYPSGIKVVKGLGHLPRPSPLGLFSAGQRGQTACLSAAQVAKRDARIRPSVFQPATTTPQVTIFEKTVRAAVREVLETEKQASNLSDESSIEWASIADRVFDAIKAKTYVNDNSLSRLLIKTYGCKELLASSSHAANIGLKNSAS